MSGKKGFFGKLISKKIRLQFSTCGEIFIDSLPFSFGVESIGASSDKGISVSISGEAVDKGIVKFSDLEYNEMHGGDVTVVKMNFPLVTKKDGKKIYHADFRKIPITEYSTGMFGGKVTEESVISRLNAEIGFKVTPHFSATDDAQEQEVLLTVYPNENPLEGACSQWINVTSDKDYFIHKFRKGK